MKILLIGANIASTPYPVYPLGLSMVSSALRSAGHEVYHFDFLQSDMSLEVLTREIGRIDPEIIGISIRNIDNVNLLNEQRYIDTVKDIVKNIRQQTSVPVVLGGSGFSMMPEAILREVGADYGIVGEGESLMLGFVSDAARGVYPSERCIRNPSGLHGRDIPSAYYDPGFMEFYLRNGSIAPIQTKRGCTHKCVYCSYPFLEGATIRSREPGAVVDDILFLTENLKVRYIFFIDSVFNDEEGHYLDVVREMENQNIHVPWTAFFKPGKITEENVALMKKTGLKAVEIGADASTDTTLRRLGKSFGFRDIIEFNELFVRHDIATAHFYMFGGPGETQETVMEGIENIRNLKNTVSFMFMGIRILPHTALARIAIREGIISPDQELLKPVYYISPSVDKEWLEETLVNGFSGIRHCVFPPDALESSLKFLHKLGYAGSMWDLLIPGRGKRNRRGKLGIRN
ncbi:lipid biosynthesis B12-binding/radical SAM protein [Desulfococcaceae bacterium HSG8]|nr:lipid biosynthesis B12-binding/radical SAM protein [Desulfococcaceae bacterium HSG8]